MPGPKVSIVIVSYNTLGPLRRCLRAVASEFETIVVDNGSSDGSPDMVAAEFPQVRLIRSERNLGFGPANNLGMDAATGDLVLFLNSDCYAHEGAVARLAAAFDPTVVAAGGKLLNPDGSLQESVAGRLTLGAVAREQLYLDAVWRRLAPAKAYWRTRWALARAKPTAEVDQVMGACLMCRPVERFDERFFLYCEDTELCQRLSKHGRILYVPGAEFTHDLGSSSRKEPWLGVARYNRGKELCFRLHRGRWAAAVCWGLNRLGALLRLLAWLPASRAKARLFWRVLTVRGAP